MLIKRLLAIIANSLLLSVLLACSENVEQNYSVSPSTNSFTSGQLLVKENCKVCHAQGINGAPILGNKKNWAKRLPQGEEVLIKHAIEGFGLMPAKGGKVHLSDEQIAIAVIHMISLIH